MKLTNKNGLSLDAYTNKMDLMEVKLDQIERKLSNKADDVVSIQLFEHRRELEELYKAVSKIEAHLKLIDEELSAITKEEAALTLNKKKRGGQVGKVTPLFS